ncbi:winged helix-turn-helix transcriptional regulator [Homoserinimonas sp. A447]
MGKLIRECSVAHTLELVGAKWSLLIVRELLLGIHRFDEIVHYTGAPRDVLTVRLRHLEEGGFVTRVQYQERPPRFEYHLTDLGNALGPIISMLREFGDRHLTAEAESPLTFTHTCGEVYHPVDACQSCGHVVRRGEITERDAPQRSSAKQQPIRATTGDHIEGSRVESRLI